ncbi:MAG TPA: folate-binding protein YgfZ [Polyangiaceae bacterium]
MASSDDSRSLASGASAAEAALRQTALVVAEGERGVLSVRGPDRVAWLNGVVTCDAAAVTPDQAQFGLLLSKQGKIQTDFALLLDGDRFLLAVAPGTAELAREELDRMLVMEEVELTDVSAELSVLALHGPRADALARDAASRFGGAAASLDRTGLGGAVLLVPERVAGDVAAGLEAAGARLAQAEDWPRVRVPHGVAMFGADYGQSDNPHEAALDRRAIAWNKGCYLGQEAVFMQDARGKVKRRLVVLRVEGPATPPTGAAIERPDGGRAGEVTSSTDGARPGEHYALGKVLAPDYEPGTNLVVAGSPARVLGPAFAAARPP